MTALPKNQAVIDAYAAGTSYKTLARLHHRGEHRIRDMIYLHAPSLMRTRSEQASLAARINPAIRAFCPEDLGLVWIGLCKKCGIELVGKTKTKRRQTCGLCRAWKASARTI